MKKLILLSAILKAHMLFAADANCTTTCYERIIAPEMIEAGAKYYIEAGLGVSSVAASGSQYFSPIGFAPQISPLEIPVYRWVDKSGPIQSSAPLMGLAGVLNFGRDFKVKRNFLYGMYFGFGGTGAHTRIPGADGTANYRNSETDGVDSYSLTSVDRVSDGFFMNVGLRAGFTVGRTLAFLRIGYAPHHVGIKFSRTETIYTKTDINTVNDASLYKVEFIKKRTHRWVHAIAVGIGIEYNLSQNWIMGAMLEGHFGPQKDWFFKKGIPRFEYTADQIPGTNEYQNYNNLVYPRYRLKTQFTQFLFTFKYAMPRCNQAQ